MRKTFRKITVGDVLVSTGSKAYASSLPIGDSATVARIEHTHGGAYIEIYDDRGVRVFRGQPGILATIA